MELQTQLGTVFVQTLGELMHGLDVIIMAHGQLREGGSGSHIIDTADAGNNQADTAFRTFFIIVHQPLGGLAVCLPEAEFRCSHNGTVLDFHRTDLHGRKQMFKTHIFIFLPFVPVSSGNDAVCWSPVSSRSCGRTGRFPSGPLPVQTVRREIPSSYPFRFP